MLLTAENDTTFTVILTQSYFCYQEGILKGTATLMISMFNQKELYES